MTMPLDEVRAQIEAIRASIHNWHDMANEVRPSPSDVHSHICHEVAEVEARLIEVIDAIEDVLTARKAQADALQAKINEIIAWIANADNLKLKLGNVPGAL